MDKDLRMRDGGKGDKPRPLSVPMEQFDNNWDAIFKQAKELSKNIKVVNEVFYEELEEYQKQAAELWNDSCTSNRSKK